MTVPSTKNVHGVAIDHCLGAASRKGCRSSVRRWEGSKAPGLLILGSEASRLLTRSPHLEWWMLTVSKGMFKPLFYCLLVAMRQRELMTSIAED